MLCVRRMQRNIWARMANAAERASKSHNGRPQLLASLASSVVIWMRSNQQNVRGNDVWHIHPWRVRISQAHSCSFPLPTDLDGDYHGEQRGQVWQWQGLCQPWSLNNCLYETKLCNEKHPSCTFKWAGSKSIFWSGHYIFGYLFIAAANDILISALCSIVSE